MRTPRIDDYVRLTAGIPELCLRKGDVGIVRSTWFSPTTAYEIEFGEGNRVLLLPEQVEVDTEPMMMSPSK